MIHKIVEDALKQIDQYDVQRRSERYDMIYCVGRIESATGYRTAMQVLNQHLDKHYTLKGDTPSLFSQNYYPHENGIDMLKEV